MTKKELHIANGAIILLIIFSTWVTLERFSNQQIQDIFLDSFQPPQETVQSTETSQLEETCTDQPVIELTSAQDPHIKQLQKYQEICNSAATQELMIFTTMPANQNDAQVEALTMSQTLREFQTYGIQPIVIVEPYNSLGAVNYTSFLNGTYTPALNVYFATLQENGITDEMMGTWVPFPESNTPNWDNKDTEPSDFAQAVNIYLGSLKATFPNAKGSILLNSATYEPTDELWDNGDYLSLVPYLQDIDRELVDSFGIQGFPWVSPSTQTKRQIYRAEEFLQPDLMIDAARELRTKDIWINTGSFYARYADSPEARREVSVSERQAIMNEILDVARQIQEFQLNEYRVSINIFAEDKTGTPENVDFSYFQSETQNQIFKDFLKQASEEEIPISLFDKVSQ